MSVEQVQKLLGHIKLDTTMEYAMVSQNNVKNSHRKYVNWKFFKKYWLLLKKYGIFKIQKAINLYKLHIILLLEIAKKVGESSHKVGT